MTLQADQLAAVKAAVKAYGKLDREEATQIAWEAVLSAPDSDPFETASSAVRQWRNRGIIHSCTLVHRPEVAEAERAAHRDDGEYTAPAVTWSALDASQLPEYLQRALAAVQAGEAIHPMTRYLLKHFCQAIVSGDTTWVDKYYADHRQCSARYRAEHADYMRNWYAQHREQHREQQRAYVAANRERVRALRRKRYLATREDTIEKAREWKRQHLEQYKQNAQKWYAAHREELKAYQKAYYAAHKEELKARRLAKKEAKDDSN